MKRFSPLFLLWAVFSLAACTTTEKFSNDTPQMVAAPDAVSAMLADAADKASNALQTLASVEAARTPPAVMPPVGEAPAELRRAVSVNWIGPVEPIAQKLSERAGYQFMVIGAPPVTPIVVSIDAENRPVIDVLRDIGLQLGVRADVKVDGDQHVIEIHYAPNTGVAG